MTLCPTSAILERGRAVMMSGEQERKRKSLEAE
eukprot:CAMPEP_0114548408 /NCGR_PEP_ID=MMETSP0114-20121206/4963_1 /TAXON_ID=31324 /ORGANISM="Goniomonas sp, Strain m" /LENGTH=32 /DNA_ID= /DNA_START= /DNA_END= /DNA_ORIENTATION=